jgi:hypothetical protein
MTLDEIWFRYYLIFLRALCPNFRMLVRSNNIQEMDNVLFVLNPEKRTAGSACDGLCRGLFALRIYFRSFRLLLYRHRIRTSRAISSSFGFYCQCSI